MKPVDGLVKNESSSMDIAWIRGGSPIVSKRPPETDELRSCRLGASGGGRIDHRAPLEHFFTGIQSKSHNYLMYVFFFLFEIFITFSGISWCCWILLSPMNSTHSSLDVEAERLIKRCNNNKNNNNEENMKINEPCQGAQRVEQEFIN